MGGKQKCGKGKDRKIHLSKQKGDLAWKGQYKYMSLKKEWNLIFMSV